MTPTPTDKREAARPQWRLEPCGPTMASIGRWQQIARLGNSEVLFAYGETPDEAIAEANRFIRVIEDRSKLLADRDALLAALRGFLDDKDPFGDWYDNGGDFCWHCHEDRPNHGAECPITAARAAIRAAEEVK